MTTTTIITIVLVLASVGIVSSHSDCPFARVEVSNVSSCCGDGKLFKFGISILPLPSGVHKITLSCECLVRAEVYCDSISGGGGWLVVQRRKDGSGDFNRNWAEYEDGFGDLDKEFWYGLRALHCLTGNGGWEMRIDLQLANKTKIVLQYKKFIVGSAADQYKLSISGFHGTTTDPMAYHNGMKFTTYDRDNDPWGRNCADWLGPTVPAGGWWYNQCHHLNPNVIYNHIYGVFLNSQWHTLPFVEMKIRPLNCIIN